MTQLDRAAPLGFVGLGNLGLPMVTALVRAGWPVTAYDVRPDAVRAAVDTGASGAHSLADLAGCRVLALAVPDDEAVTSSLRTPGVLADLADDPLVVVHSTVLPATAEPSRRWPRDVPAGFVDAPVSGGAERAAEGTLTVMAGADQEVLSDAEPYLDAIADHVVHVGAPGAGSAVKLANQLMMFAALSRCTRGDSTSPGAYDVDPATVLKVAATSTGDSWVARSWGFFDQVAAAYDAGRGSGGVRGRGARTCGTSWRPPGHADIQLPVAGLLAQTLADTVEHHHREAANSTPQT